jgi:hypothetical protein
MVIHSPLGELEGAGEVYTSSLTGRVGVGLIIYLNLS